MFDEDAKNEQLRRASGKVLAAYAIRFGRVLGTSFKLETWGDLTIAMVCNLARWEMLSQRGYNPALPADVTIKALADDAKEILNEISDITNKTPRSDPDASDGTPCYEELGAIGHSEGGPNNEADAWTHSHNRALHGFEH